MQKITPCLWFDTQAEEAAKFYTSLFKNSKVGTILRYDKASSQASGLPEGSVLTVEFELEGQNFLALNGGPIFKFSESVSFQVDCKDQEEVDYFWNALTANGGEESACSWLKDKYGLSWQIVPRRLTELLADKNPARAARAMQAMLQMRKIDIAKIEEAANAEESVPA